MLLEAMAARRPVLATNVGSCREIIEGFPDEFGPCGEVAPVMNPAQIARGILKIGESTAVMRSLGGKRLAQSGQILPGFRLFKQL